MPAPRRSPQRLQALQELVADSDAGRPYRFAAALEPGFLQQLLDGDYAEARQEGRHPLGGPSWKVYALDRGRELLARWQSS